MSQSILIADDSQSTRFLLKDILLSWNYQVIEVTDGMEVWKIYEEHKFPSLAILDWIMPGYSGVELCKKIKASQTDGYKYIILLTGKSNMSDILTGIDAGADDFLSKPVNPKLLKSRLMVAERILRYERSLIEERTKAEQANRAKAQFLANMSHEIRTPMNAIIGMTDLTLETELNEEQHEYLSIVKTSSESLLTLLNDIMDFSKIEAGKLELSPTNFTLREALSEMLQGLSIQTHEKELELLYSIDTKVPDAVFGDSSRLRQIIINLVGNAVKFTQEGEIFLKVQLESETTDEVFLHIQVLDTGIGIPFEKQQVIFQEFNQADASMARKYGGTGLGLTISSRLVEMMNGKLWVESPLPASEKRDVGGPGSIFHFTLALKKSTQNEPIQPPIPVSLPVLIWMKNTTASQGLVQILTEWNFQPLLVSNWEEMLQKLRISQEQSNPIQSVLVDAKMLSPESLIRIEEIQTDAGFSQIKLILLNRLGGKYRIDHYKEFGFFASHPHPVKNSDLYHTLLKAHGLETTDPDSLSSRESPANRIPSLNILVAEDNLFNQKLVTRILKKQGHRYTVANNGLEAVQLYRQGSFDCILMDVHMPEMDGFAACRQIRDLEKNSGRHIPILAVTASAMKGDLEACLAEGMDDYISKPMKSEDLQKKLAGRFSQKSLPDPEPTATPMESVISDPKGVLAHVDGNVDELKELATLFLENAAETLSKIQTAIRDKNFEQLKIAAHSLKGAVGFFSAAGVKEAALRLELIGKNQTEDPHQAAWSTLKVEMNRLIEEFRQRDWIDHGAENTIASLLKPESVLSSF